MNKYRICEKIYERGLSAGLLKVNRVATTLAHEITTWCGCQMSARTTQNMCRAIHTVHLAPNMLYSG